MTNHTINLSARTSAMVMGKAQLSLYTPLPETHPFYAKIGRVVAEWTQFQHVLQTIIWHLEGVRDLGEKPKNTNRASASDLFRRIDAQLRSEGREVLLKKHKLTEDRIKDVNEERNRIVHDPWYVELNTNQTAQFRYIEFDGRHYGFHDVLDAKVDKVIEQIKALQEAAHGLRVDL